MDRNDLANEIGLDEREKKMLGMCISYGEDPFGAPNHMLMNIISKLWRYLEQEKLFKQ